MPAAARPKRPASSSIAIRGATGYRDRGPLAALTAAGDLSGWAAAARISAERWGGTMPWPRLLEDAIHHAGNGVAVTNSLHDALTEKQGELRDQPGFAETYFADGAPLPVGARLRLSKLSATLEHLARAGAEDFYRGDLARTLAADLEAVGSPLRLTDLERHQALELKPLEVEVDGHRIFNMPPPTQGLASLIILGLYARLRSATPEGFDYVHKIVEATKQAFRVRDTHVTDPAYMTVDPASFPDRRCPRRHGGGHRSCTGGTLARCQPLRRHGLARRGRRRGPGREFHSEPLLGVRIRRDPAAVRHHLAEPRRQLQS